jgi:hypothetical protein
MDPPSCNASDDSKHDEKAPSHHTPSPDSTEGRSWHLARSGTLQQIQAHVGSTTGSERQFCLDMALMGASQNASQDERPKIKG